MTSRTPTYAAVVATREELSPHLVRLRLNGPGLGSFQSSGVPDEWVGLVVPGQFQSRYYTVRAWDGTTLTLDVVRHETGLVADWAAGDCVGDQVTISAPRGTFAAPEDAGWLLLVADLTGLPAIARIVETRPDLRTRVWVEAPEAVPGYLPEGLDVTWTAAGSAGSRLAAVVEQIDWPAGHGYFWMAGESAQMRAIRKHLMHDRQLPKDSYDVTGYWRAVLRRQPRVADPQGVADV